MGLFENISNAAGQFGETMGNSIGRTFNAISGTTASQQFEANEAQKSRDWQERMSNTAYQRAVKDMQTAGLNPAAMYGGTGGAAATPSGAKASGAVTSGNAIGNIAMLVNSAANMTRSMNDRNEQAAKAKIYDKSNQILQSAVKLSKFLK